MARWYFVPVFRISWILSLAFLLCIESGRHPIMIAIAASEAMGLLSEWSRIFFSFIIIFIALLCEVRSRIFLPPVLKGLLITFVTICGGIGIS